MTRCWLSKHAASACMFRADGQPDRAHLIPAQRLRNAGIDAWADNRCWVPACRHHHHLLDSRKINLQLADYPRDFLDFATEYGLYHASVRDGWRVEGQGRAA